MHKTPFEQNVIALVWDCDKTLISSYMQEPLFEHYQINGSEFWKEVNALEKFYQSKGIRVNADTSYLNHILTYVKSGVFKGLNNALLKEFGASLKFYPGLPKFFKEVQALIENDEKYKAFDIHVEHYIVSTGFAETIRGSKIAPFVEDVFGCEFIEAPVLPGFKISENAEAEISQVACALDNTSKTRYLFEINKGANKYPNEINVNSTIAKKDRRVPFENMIYIADGPSDVPAFSILNSNGGTTFAVYSRGDIKGFKQVEDMREKGRVQMFGEADYETGSHTWLWLTEKVRAIAEKIVAQKQDSIRSSASAPPGHLS